MKKAYQKPQLFKESFQPADAIAGPCYLDVHFSEDTCKIWDDKVESFLFSAANMECQDMWVEGENKGCYHVPVDGQQYFGS